MTKDDIRQMARESNLHWYANDLNEEPFFEIVERFAKLVAAAEREVSQERINSLYKLYEQAAQQRDKLMEQQAYTVRALDTIRTLRKLKEENGG